MPLLAEAFPNLVADILDLLEPEDEQLARTILDLRFHGRCSCTPTCPVLLTAPAGSPSAGIIMLDRDDDCVIWLHYDAEQSAVTGIEVLDGRELD
ncbi:hypothetical protein ACFXHA_13575 [Nocardia sp. NPDC059240]|uniref:hypothetical protein n=1 Tax=Nocardia sp. NPDC059240 TaxID=3346786 RepID=UPI0036C96FF8